MDEKYASFFPLTLFTRFYMASLTTAVRFVTISAGLLFIVRLLAPCEIDPDIKNIVGINLPPKRIRQTASNRANGARTSYMGITQAAVGTSTIVSSSWCQHLLKM